MLRAPRLRLLLACVSAMLALFAGGCATEADIRAWEQKQAELRARAETTKAANDGLELFKPAARAKVSDLDSALALPVEQQDLAQTLLLFSREYAPTSGFAMAKSEAEEQAPESKAGTRLTLEAIDALLFEIDQWKVELAARSRKARSKDERIAELTSFIHFTLGFGYDPDPLAGYRVDNLLLDRVLARRKGYCVTLSAVYLILAPAAGVELDGVRLPGHFAVQTRGERWPSILETTAMGARRNKADMYMSFRMSPASVDDNGAFLAPLTGADVVSTLMSNLGALYVVTERSDLALPLLNRAIELSPKNVDARFNRAGVYLGVGDATDVQLALADLNEAIRLDPNHYVSLARRAGLHARFGDSTKADADLRTAMRLRPDLSVAWVEKGVMLYGLGDLKGAKVAFEEALQRDAACLDALRNLAVVAGELGEGAEAARRQAEHDGILAKIRAPEAIPAQK